MPRRAAQADERPAATLLLYSWQPIRQLAGTDGSRHAGMAQRLMQVVRAACRVGLEVVFVSGQSISRPARSASQRGQVFVGGCRVAHFYGSTEQQYARLLGRA
eukprot:1623425-Prymnesium_polylepis.1